ncbi:MAG: hypothetical protein ACI9BK_002279, partial [Acidimicrobiales bacterium]
RRRDTPRLGPVRGTGLVAIVIELRQRRQIEFIDGTSTADIHIVDECVLAGVLTGPCRY